MISAISINFFYKFATCSLLSYNISLNIQSKMMCDTNWCTFCDNAISPYSDSLYCSEDCLRQDALMHHPMLGYDYAELQGFPHHYQQQPKHHPNSTLPSLVRRKSSIPSLNNNDFTQSQKIPSLSPSLSSSISSYTSATHPYDSHEILASNSYFHPKPRRVSNSIPSFMDQ